MWRAAIVASAPLPLCHAGALLQGRRCQPLPLCFDRRTRGAAAAGGTGRVRRARVDRVRRHQGGSGCQVAREDRDAPPRLGRALALAAYLCAEEAAAALLPAALPVPPRAQLDHIPRCPHGHGRPATGAAQDAVPRGRAGRAGRGPRCGAQRLQGAPREDLRPRRHSRRLDALPAGRDRRGVGAGQPAGRLAHAAGARAQVRAVRGGARGRPLAAQHRLRCGNADAARGKRACALQQD
mmetsp:Transcript_12870/g.41117  ORF Transcript_12870/g.41117 Transcript_12870/m.41117 type:complete len:238 (+) Transcript_12870:2629-3342(+)